MSINSQGRPHSGRPQPVPTRDFPPEKPHAMRSSITSVPSSIIYLFAFVFVVFGLTFLIFGAVHVEDCEIEPMIPIWLLITGIIGSFLTIWGSIIVMGIKKSPFKRVSGLKKLITGILLLFFIGWFIAGNVWVYSAWGESPDFAHHWFGNYCDLALFNMSLATVITLDIMVCLGLVLLCIWGLSHCIVKE